MFSEKLFISLFTFEVYFYCLLNFGFFFFQFKYLTPPSHFHGFLRKVESNYYLCSSIGKVLFCLSFSFFQDLLSDLLQYAYDMPRCGYFSTYTSWCSLSLLDLWLGFYPLVICPLALGYLVLSFMVFFF